MSKTGDFKEPFRVNIANENLFFLFSAKLQDGAIEGTTNCAYFRFATHWSLSSKCFHTFPINNNFVFFLSPTELSVSKTFNERMNSFSLLLSRRSKRSSLSCKIINLILLSSAEISLSFDLEIAAFRRTRSEMFSTHKCRAVSWPNK